MDFKATKPKKKKFKIISVRQLWDNMDYNIHIFDLFQDPSFLLIIIIILFSKNVNLSKN